MTRYSGKAPWFGGVHPSHARTVSRTVGAAPELRECLPFLAVPSTHLLPGSGRCRVPAHSPPVDRSVLGRKLVGSPFLDFPSFERRNAGMRCRRETGDRVVRARVSPRMDTGQHQGFRTQRGRNVSRPLASSPRMPLPSAHYASDSDSLGPSWVLEDDPETGIRRPTRRCSLRTPPERTAPERSGPRSAGPTAPWRAENRRGEWQSSRDSGHRWLDRVRERRMAVSIIATAASTRVATTPDRSRI